MKKLDYGVYKVGGLFLEKKLMPVSEEMLQSVPDDEFSSITKKAIKEEGGLPVIEISEKLGLWSTKFVFGSHTYMFLDSCDAPEGEITESGVVMVVYNMFFACCVKGDAELVKDWYDAMIAYNERVLNKYAVKQG